MKVLLVKILILSSLNGLGQNSKIIGHVTMTDILFDPNNLLLILKSDSVEVSRTMLDSDGTFKLNKMGIGTFSIVIHQIGNRDAVTEGIIVVDDTLISLNLVYPPPCTFKTHKNPECIDGHKDKIIPIVYGLPSKRTMRKAKKGKIHLAGCNLTGCDPQFYCIIHKKEL